MTGHEFLVWTVLCKRVLERCLFRGCVLVIKNAIPDAKGMAAKSASFCTECHLTGHEFLVWTVLCKRVLERCLFRGCVLVIKNAIPDAKGMAGVKTCQ